MALAAVVVFVALLGSTALPRGHVFTGDTPKLVHGTRVALECVRQSQWTRCGLLNPRFSAVREYPVLQYFPVAAMVQSGWSDRAILRALGVLSFAAFLTTLVLLVRAGRHLSSPMWTPLLLAVALTGPLLFYSTSAFGEMLTASLVLACMVAVLERRPALILVLTLVAGLGKETLPPFVLALGIIVGRRDRDGWLPPRRVLLPLLAGSAASALVAGAFNEFRFGSWGNENYLQPAFRISHVRAARNLWNLLVAFDGGLTWFWTSMSLLLVALAFVAFVGLAQRRRSTLPSFAVLAVFAALMIGLASWYSPFGWVAWGPRLTLPLLPALVVAAAYAGGERLSAAVAGVMRRTWALIALLAIVLISAWPQAGAPWQADRVAGLVQFRQCSASPRSHSEAFYDCEDLVAWRHHDNQLVAASTGGGRAGLAGELSLIGAVSLLVLESRRRASGDAQDSSGRTPGAAVRSTM